MKVLSPSYLKSFKCIGSSCKDNCCIGWAVDIDKTTYEKYEKVGSEPLKSIMEEHVHENPDCYDEAVDFAVVSLTKSHRCPFLTEKNLCKIQCEYGEAYLSNVCNQFPRMYNRVDGKLEVSASVSCPEIAEIMVKCSEGLSFEIIEQSDAREVMVGFDVMTKDDVYKGTPVEMLLKIRWICMDIMQNRLLPIDERFKEVGAFVFSLTNVSGKQNITRLMDAQRSKKYESQSLKTPMHFSVKTLEVSKDILALLNPDRTIESKRYLSYVNEAEAAIDGMGIVEVIAGKSKYFDPYFDERVHVIENFFSNHMFKSLFPFTEAEWTFHAYLLMLCRFILIKRQLVGLAISRKGLDDALIMDYLQVFSKAIEHHRHFMLDLTDWFYHLKIDNMKSVTKRLI